MMGAFAESERSMILNKPVPALSGPVGRQAAIRERIQEVLQEALIALAGLGFARSLRSLG
jgi:hypothetical protein